MPINRERVQKFLYEVDSEITPSICADAGRLNGYKKLLDIYRAACTAWHNRSVEDIQGITAAVNEMCIARLILKDNQVGNAFYEPHLKGTNKTIDFLVNLVGREARIFYDVKTVQPTKQDAWDRYTNFQKEGWLTPHTELELEQEAMEGEIAHELFASRQKFLDYTLELEEKIRAIPKNPQDYFRLVFCGDGVQWRSDYLEDFADFYFSGHCRADDTLGSMQTHYMVANEIIFDRIIHEFCHLS